MWTTNSQVSVLGMSAVFVVVMAIVSSFASADAQSPDQSRNVTSTILKNAGEDFSKAIEALNNNNVTGAVNEARSGMFYLEMLGIPNNCLINDDEMLQCGFPR
jgi:hypothetical protein